MYSRERGGGVEGVKGGFLKMVDHAWGSVLAIACMRNRRKKSSLH